MKLCTGCKISKPTEEFRMNGKYRKAECRGCQDKKNREWAERNRDKVKTYLKKYYKENKDRFRELNREWHKNHPGYAASQARKWSRENREAYLLMKLRNENIRRGRKQGNGGTFTVQEWIDLCTMYNQTCLSCGVIGPLTIDHIIPISKGGSNFIENIQPLCSKCNSSKGTRSWNYKHWFMVA